MTLLDSSIHPFLTSQILSILSKKKIFTIENFLAEPVDKLITITKLSFKNTLQIKTSVLNNFAPPLHMGTDLATTRSSPVSSGISGVDAILQDGFYPGSMYEVCSPAGEGKTQFCHCVATNVRHPVYYLDSKGDFSAKRICQINSKSNCQEILSRIRVCRVTSLLHVIQVLYDLVAKFDSNGGQEINIVILDSVSTHFYSLLDSAHNCQAYLSQIGNLLKCLALKHNCIILTTNLLSLASEPHEEDRVGMGKYWNHVPHVRIKMRRSGDDYHVSVLQTNSGRLRVNQTEVMILSSLGFC